MFRATGSLRIRRRRRQTGWGGRLADALQSANAGTAVGVDRHRRLQRLLQGSGDGRPYTIVPYAAGSTIVSPVKRVPRASTRWPMRRAPSRARSRWPARNLLEDAVRAHRRATRCRTTRAVLDAVYSTGRKRYLRRAPTAFDRRSRRPDPLATQLRSVAMTDRRAAEPRRQAAGLLRLAGWLRHPQRPVRRGGRQHVARRRTTPAILFGKHAELLTQLDAALKAFYDATVELGVAEQRHDVHGVGLRAHADVERHGFRPRLGWASPDHGRRGEGRQDRTARSTTCRSARAIRPTPVKGASFPTISVDQYAGTMARWMGASSADLNVVFPNLANFNQVDLGFMT